MPTTDTESPSQTSGDSPREAWRHAYLPAAIAVGWVVVDLLILGTSFIPKSSEPSDRWITFVVGLVLAQLSYGGLWGAFGPGSAAIRIPLILGGSALAIAGFFRQLVYRNELEVWFLGFFLILLLLFQGLILGSGLFLQRVLAVRVSWGREAPSLQQFGVRDILSWMAGVGVLITLFRFSFGAVVFNTNYAGNLAEDIVIVTVVLVSALWQTLLAGWTAFPSDGSRGRWLSGWVLSLLSAGVGCVPLLFALRLEGYLIVALMLLLQYGILWSQLAFLRWHGLQLVDSNTYL